MARDLGWAAIRLLNDAYYKGGGEYPGDLAKGLASMGYLNHSGVGDFYYITADGREAYRNATRHECDHNC